MTTSTNAAATGTIAALYRYPVKSMQGTTEATLTVTSTGVGGDRSWGLLDLATDRLASAKRFSALLAATGGDGVVTLPGGTEVDLTDPGADAALSAWLGRDVRVVRAPDSVLAHPRPARALRRLPPRPQLGRAAVPTQRRGGPRRATLRGGRLGRS